MILLNFWGDKVKRGLKKKITITLFLIWILALIYSFYNAYITGTSKIRLFTDVITIGCVAYILSSIIGLARFSWWIIKEKVKGIMTFVLIVVIAFIIPVVVHFVFFNSNSINETDILSFYGSYITFLGTFGLGYIVYRRDKIIRLEEKLNKAKLLHSCLDSIIDQMNILDNNPKRIKKIEYDLQWKKYYFEISTLGFKNELYLRTKLESIFSRVDSINYDLEQGKNEEAQKKYKNFIRWEQYWPTKFNFIEARSMLYHIAYLWNSIKLDIPWDEEEEYKQNIEKYGEQFFAVIENWIWNYMLKHNIDCLKIDTIIFNLVDWLMTNRELKGLVKTPYDKRIISAIVTSAKFKMNKKSKLLNYYWDEFTLKENK